MKQAENADDYAPLSDEELEKFVQYLDSGADLRGEPAFGLEMEFMERNGFDVGWVAGGIIGYANRLDSPLAFYDEEGTWKRRGRSESYCKSLALQIRDYYRKKFGLHLLSDNEKLTWRFNTLSSTIKEINDRWSKWHEDSRAKGPLDQYYLTDDDVKNSAIYINEKYPEVARYISAVRNVSQQQGYDGWNSVGRLWLIDFFVDDAVKACSGMKPGEMTTDNRKVENEVARITQI